MRRWLLVVIMMGVLAAPVSAQMPGYCGQLSEADCALMHDGQRSLADMRDAVLNHAIYTIGDGLNIEISGRGRIVNQPFHANPEPVSLENVQADVTVTLDLADLPPALSSVKSVDAVHIRLIEGILYIDLDSLVPAEPTLHGWVSVDLKKSMPDTFDAEAAPPPSPVSEMASQIVTGLDVDQLVATFDPAVLNPFLTVAHTGDSFETKVDFAALYADPVFQAVLQEQLLNWWTRYGHPGEVTDEELAHLAAEMAAMFPEPVTVSSIRVDPETRTVRGIQSWTMFDFLIMVEAGLKGEPISQRLQSGMTLSVSFDDDPAFTPVVAPDNAQPITRDLLTKSPVLAFLFSFAVA
ncbi:MAG: hypothetical protein K8J31_30065 [Anaerolineae bacterium]|nr:hypothetical protein [Anaerolineae bacterium]